MTRAETWIHDEDVMDIRYDDAVMWPRRGFVGQIPEYTLINGGAVGQRYFEFIFSSRSVKR